jgi:hypothetical protein
MEAEKPNMEVMETRKTVLEPEHPGTLTSLANLHTRIRDYGRMMETSKTAFGPRHPDTLTGMAYLTSTYIPEPRTMNEGRKLEVQVMEKSKTVLAGPEHPDTLTGMANLASTYWNQGLWPEAGSWKCK